MIFYTPISSVFLFLLKSELAEKIQHSHVIPGQETKISIPRHCGKKCKYPDLKKKNVKSTVTNKILETTTKLWSISIEKRMIRVDKEIRENIELLKKTYGFVLKNAYPRYLKTIL